MSINGRDLDNYITGHYGEDQFRWTEEEAAEEVAQDKDLPTCDYCPSKLHTEQEQSKRLCKFCQL